MCGYGHCRKRVWWLLLGQVVIFVVIIHVTDLIFKVLAIILHAHLPIYYLQPVHFFQLLQRDPEHRLGCMEEREPIRSHPFFRALDWYKLERREVPPPFKPHVVRSAWQWIIYELNFGTKYYVQSLPNHIFYIVWPTHDVVHWWHIEAWLEICYNYHPMIRLIVHWLRYTMTP